MYTKKSVSLTPRRQADFLFKGGVMSDENTSLDSTKRETVNPLVDNINKEIEPLLKVAMNEMGFKLPLTLRVYNQIRFYEEYGKLHLKTSVASKETLAKQFGVKPKQIEAAFNNLTNKYKLGVWVDHNEPVFRNVRRTWMSHTRLKQNTNSYYSVIPELLQRNSTSITVEQLATGALPLSESKKKVSENNNSSNEELAKAPVYGKPDINEMFELWEKTLGYPIQAQRQKNRNACNSLIKKHGLDGLTRLISGVALAQEDKYAPSIADFAELQSKLNRLMQWGKKQQQENNEEVF